MSSFYSEEELNKLGLKSYGKNVLISKNASIYGASHIEIGNNVRIDDFCILSGNIKFGDYIHIAAGVFIFAGDAGVVLEDFCGISSRTALYAASDDYSGNYMTNPTIPDEYRNVQGGLIHIGKHALIGTGCTVLPGVSIGEDSSIGAMSLINKDIEPYTMNVGIPCKKIKDRSKKIFELEEEFVEREKVKRLIK